MQTLLPVGLSNYSSLQTKLHRNITHGYSVLASYTFAHSLDNGPAPFDLGKGGNYPQSPFNIPAEYQIPIAMCAITSWPARLSSCRSDTASAFSPIPAVLPRR